MLLIREIDQIGVYKKKTVGWEKSRPCQDFAPTIFVFRSTGQISTIIDVVSVVPASGNWGDPVFSS